MRIRAKCKSCKERKVNFLTSVNDRGELAMKKGKEFKCTCKACHKMLKYHVNDFKAESSINVKLGGVIIFIVGLLILLFIVKRFFTGGYLIVGGVFLLPSIAYGIAKQQEITKLNSFNRYKVKE